MGDVLLAERQTLCISQVKILPLISCKISEEKASVILIAPKLVESTLVSGPQGDAGGYPLVDSPQKGATVSSGWLLSGTPSRAVEPARLATSGILEELSTLPPRVIDMITQSRALY